MIIKLLTKGINHKSFYQTRIGKLPIEWKISTIGSKCRVGTGGTPSRRQPEYFEGNIPWVKTTPLGRAENTYAIFGELRTAYCT
jgi:type I restriction enzyme S subunit